MAQKTGLIAIAVIAIVIIAAAAYLVTQPEAAPGEEEEEEEEEEIFRVGAVIPGDITDLDWSQDQYMALMRLDEDPTIEVDFVWGVPSPVDAGVHFESWAAAEYDLVFSGSATHMPALPDIARAYPDTNFAVFGGYPVDDQPPNLTNWYLEGGKEYGYLFGVVAGRMTKTNKIGYIGGIDVGDGRYCRLALGKGAKSVNPDVEVTEIIVGGFYDVAAGKEAALLMIDDGVDIIVPLGDGTGTGSILGAAERNVWFIGRGAGRKGQAPHIYLGGVKYHVDSPLRSLIEDIEAGTHPPQTGPIPLLLGSGFVEFLPWHENVPSEVIDEFEDLKEQIIEGTLVIEVEE